MADWTWTERRVERLKLLWEAGKSAGECQAIFCEDLKPGEEPCTRSAILGKVHRLNLSARRGSAAKPINQIVPVRSLAKPKGDAKGALIKHGLPDAPRAKNQFDVKARAELRETEPGLPEKYNTKPTGDGISLVQLNDANCHWPLGDPRDDNFEFCGKPASVKSIVSGTAQFHPYCAGHCAIAYRPPQDRKASNRNAAFHLNRA